CSWKNTGGPPVLRAVLRPPHPMQPGQLPRPQLDAEVGVEALLFFALLEVGDVALQRSLRAAGALADLGPFGPPGVQGQGHVQLALADAPRLAQVAVGPEEV